jgi:hypothetical protein
METLMVFCCEEGRRSCLPTAVLAPRTMGPHIAAVGRSTTYFEKSGTKAISAYLVLVAIVIEFSSAHKISSAHKLMLHCLPDSR